MGCRSLQLSLELIGWFSFTCNVECITGFSLDGNTNGHSNVETEWFVKVLYLAKGHYSVISQNRQTHCQAKNRIRKVKTSQKPGQTTRGITITKDTNTGLLFGNNLAQSGSEVSFYTQSGGHI